MLRKYLHWKTYLVVLALVIVCIALVYFNRVAKDMAQQEQQRIMTIIEGVKTIALAQPGVGQNDVTFASKVVTENTTLPFIITNEEDKVLSYTNIDSARLQKDPEYLNYKLAEFKKQHEPIEVDFNYGGLSGKSYVYYGDSSLLSKLKYYPLLILAVIFFFLLIVIIAISNAQRSIQNQVWVGMSKETAHQLGTPLTSIVAWMELLKDRAENQAYITEMEKDVLRLQLIADRFSKIGSVPVLVEENIVQRLEEMVVYMRARKPQKVSIDFTHNEDDVQILLSGPLFDWVIENLMRNALDAMEGQGKIQISLNNQPRMVTIDISDTGKGIPKNSFKRVFSPGYSTKQRGWGLGLSLARRIIEKYHYGSIFVKQSEVGVGTTFRIILRR